MVQQTPSVIVNKFTVSRRASTCFRILVFAFLLASPGIFQTVSAGPLGQKQPAPVKPTTNAATKKKHKLVVTKGYITAISLKADKAKMSDIAEDLGKRLNAQVILGPSLKGSALTAEFIDLPFEMALRLLAPRVYVDYEIRANAQPTPLAVFLMGQDDPDPAKSAVVQGSSEAMVIEGNTEDVPDQPEAEEPLRVDLEDNQITIKSKKQMLVAVLTTVAEVLGVPAEIKYESTEIVDTEIKDTPYEEAIPRLSPNIRLYVRADLTRSIRTPLRLKLLPPAKEGDAAMK